jgi:hypothetical protein
VAALAVGVVHHRVEPAGHLLGLDPVHGKQGKTPTSSRRQTKIKIGSRFRDSLSSPARRGVNVVTYSRVVMNHLGLAIIEEAAVAVTSPSYAP